ncbi:Mediator of RNA polymerase II transcription subunit 24 [Camelus dromedarius]|uniref:Mediator of RNA polymerase II transcription subunit 24 n=1 Tax=Camelus dromedarius TaxID=9838 RepID=A0A5N4D770_CAMDR|nr:Mediator of RNA polymerase II transcription subunit 24 [Camelus dromedarius]
MMVKCMQHMPTPPCVLETWKARFVGLTESPEGTGELKWTVFTFLKLPQVLVKLKKYSHGDKDFTEDECSKQRLLSEASMNIIMAKRKADQEHAPQLKSDENTSIQPNPGRKLCAEPTVTNILRTMDTATLMESLVALLSNSSEMKLVQMKWHEAYLSISVAILEILNTWENGVLAFDLAVCAVAWLVAPVWMLGLDEREKSLQVIRQLAGPLYSENTLQFYNERVVTMSSILEHMCAGVLQQTATQIKFPSVGMDTMPYQNLLPPKRPIKEVLMNIFPEMLERGWVDSCSIHVSDTLLHMGGVYWFCNNLIRELLKQMQKEHPLRAVELLYSIFCLDIFTDRSMSSSLSASQLHMWFMEEGVDCLEQGSQGSILQFMPFTTVTELVQVSAMSSPKVVLAIAGLSLPLGRQVAAKAIATL